MITVCTTHHELLPFNLPTAPSIPLAVSMNSTKKILTF